MSVASNAGSKGQSQEQAQAAAKAATAPRIGQAQNPGFIGPSPQPGYVSGFGGGRVGFDTAGNRTINGQIQQGKGFNGQGAPIFAGTSYANKYFSERGVSNKGTIVNPDLFAKGDFSQIGFDKGSVGQAGLVSSPTSISQQNVSRTSRHYSVGINENVGFGEGIENKDISKNLKESTGITDTVSAVKNKPIGDQGGVQTNVSKQLGSQYSWENLGKAYGVSFLARGSTAEQQAKQKSESNAEKLFAGNKNEKQAFGFNTQRTSNTPINIDPITGLPTGNTKAEQQARSNYYGEQVNGVSVFLNQQPNQTKPTLRSKEDQNLATSLEATRATNIYNAKNEEKSAFFSYTPNKPKASQPQPSSLDIITSPDNLSNQDIGNYNLGVALSQVSAKQKNAESEKNVSSIVGGLASQGNKDVTLFDLAGNRLGKVQANQFGIDVINQILQNQPLQIGTESRKSSPTEKQQSLSFESFIKTYSEQGATINLFSGKTLIGSTSGKRALRDVFVAQQKNPNDFNVKVVPSTTREGRDLISSLQTKANNTGASSIDVYFTDQKNPPTKIESIPLSGGKQQLASAINLYSGNQNIFFSFTPKQIKNPKETTLIPASVLPQDISNVNPNKGNYIDFGNILVGPTTIFQGKSGLQFQPEKTAEPYKGFISWAGNNTKDTLQSNSIFTKELIYNFFAGTLQGAKSIPPLAVGFGTEFINQALTGKTGGVKSGKSNLPYYLYQKITNPEDYFAPNAVVNMRETTKAVHQFGLSFGLSGMVPISHPQTYGATIGTGLSYVLPLGLGVVGELRDITPIKTPDVIGFISRGSAKIRGKFTANAEIGGEGQPFTSPTSRTTPTYRATNMMREKVPSDIFGSDNANINTRTSETPSVTDLFPNQKGISRLGNIQNKLITSPTNAPTTTSSTSNFLSPVTPKDVNPSPTTKPPKKIISSLFSSEPSSITTSTSLTPSETGGVLGIQQPPPAPTQVTNPLFQGGGLGGVITPELTRSYPEDINPLGRRGTPPIKRNYPNEFNPSRAEQVNSRKFFAEDFLTSSGKKGSAATKPKGALGDLFGTTSKNTQADFFYENKVPMKSIGATSKSSRNKARVDIESLLGTGEIPQSSYSARPEFKITNLESSTNSFLSKMQRDLLKPKPTEPTFKTSETLPPELTNPLGRRGNPPIRTNYPIENILPRSEKVARESSLFNTKGIGALGKASKIKTVQEDVFFRNVVPMKRLGATNKISKNKALVDTDKILGIERENPQIGESKSRLDQITQAGISRSIKEKKLSKSILPTQDETLAKSSIFFESLPKMFSETKISLGKGAGFFTSGKGGNISSFTKPSLPPPKPFKVEPKSTKESGLTSSGQILILKEPIAKQSAIFKEYPIKLGEGKTSLLNKNKTKPITKLRFSMNELLGRQQIRQELLYKQKPKQKIKPTQALIFEPITVQKNKSIQSLLFKTGQKQTPKQAQSFMFRYAQPLSSKQATSQAYKSAYKTKQKTSLVNPSPLIQTQRQTTTQPPFISTTTTTKPPKKPPLPLIFGNIGRHGKNKTKEGPTALYNLNTNNIFASAFNINIPKNRKYEF